MFARRYAEQGAEEALTPPWARACRPSRL